MQMVQTRPLKGIQSAVKRFTENAIPEDVRRLEEHQNVMTQVGADPLHTHASIPVYLSVSLFVCPYLSVRCCVCYGDRNQTSAMSVGLYLVM